MSDYFAISSDHIVEALETALRSCFSQDSTALEATLDKLSGGPSDLAAITSAAFVVMLSASEREPGHHPFSDEEISDLVVGLCAEWDDDYLWPEVMLHILREARHGRTWSEDSLVSLSEWNRHGVAMLAGLTEHWLAIERWAAIADAVKIVVTDGESISFDLSRRWAVE